MQPTSESIGDHLLTVVHALADWAFEECAGAARVWLQILAQRCANQNPENGTEQDI